MPVENTSDFSPDSGVSFKGKSLKLNTRDDCKDVVKAIEDCVCLEYLELEGNTLGYEAACAIGDALKEKFQLKRALFKDLFTGRLKTEIPEALKALGNGLHPETRLTELDLSDNAFGPVGVEALAHLLTSPACYSLEKLKLMNNGLGISGGKMLAEALLRCNENVIKNCNKPLQLKVFIAGRNRLENEGATALAQVFQKLCSLEEITMPQNGIYHAGIAKLSAAIAYNTNLRILNLNDNTVTARGAASLAASLKYLQDLRVLNLGDCLLKTKGATLLAETLKTSHSHLEELILDSNEIGLNGGLAIVEAIKNKVQLRVLNLGGNSFGGSGRTLIEKALQKDDVLHWYSDEEDNDDMESDSDQDNDNEEEDSVNSQNTEEEVDDDERNNSEIAVKESEELMDLHKKMSSTLQIESNESVDPIQQFLNIPMIEYLPKLENMGASAIKQYFTDNAGNLNYDQCLSLILKISNLYGNNDPLTKKKSTKLATELYEELFRWAEHSTHTKEVNNSLFVSLGLIKGEDRTKIFPWNKECCIEVLKSAASSQAVPMFTQETLNLCLSRTAGSST